MAEGGQQPAELLCKAAAGTCAGLCATVLCSPLDVAKTRVQVQTARGVAHGDYDGILRALQTILREEGIGGWYHGLTPAVVSVAVFWSCYFPCYDAAKQRIAAWTRLPESAPLVHMSAAASAGLFTDVLTNPLWVVRTRLATQALRVRELAADSQANSKHVPTAATMDSVTKAAASHIGASHSNASVPAPAARSIASSKGGSSAQPPVIIYRSMMHAFVKMYREEGILSFFKGLSASVLGLSHIMIQVRRSRP